MFAPNRRFLGVRNQTESFVFLLDPLLIACSTSWCHLDTNSISYNSACMSPRFLHQMGGIRGRPI